MLIETNFTNARKDLTELYNRAWNELQPTIIKRKQTEEVLMLRKDQLQDILSVYNITPQILPETDGSITMVIEGLDIAVNGPTKDVAINALIEDLKIYAEDYQSNLQLFLHAPERKEHFPYMLKLWMCSSDEDIKALLEI